MKKTYTQKAETAGRTRECESGKCEGGEIRCERRAERRE